MRDLPNGTVTLLFSDIQGSTYLLQQLGERYPFLLAEYRQLLRAACRQWSGYEVDTQGDGLFMAFARATDSVSSAVEMQRSLAGHAWPNGVTVRARIGLHTGEPQRSAEGYVGLDVHRVARIMSAGHGGQVLLSQTTRDLVEHDLPGGVSLRDLGAHRLKDLQHPSHLFQLVIVDLPADFPPLKTLDIHPHNLPVQPTLLIGREKEVAAVEHLLRREDVHLLTLTGPGGTGKTRLGLQVAAQLSDSFADGVFFVNVAPISDPSLVVPAIAQTLAVKESTTQSLLDLLKAYLRDKQLLLLLDNFEQVISAAVQVAGLLAACPKLKVMVTSRVVLHIQGEQEFAVPPLTVPDPNHLPDLVELSLYEAVALFITRARAARPAFQVSDANARAIAEICVRLDGLPLAIELAAARLKLLPPQALLARLGQRLALLTSASQDVPTRQQTLRNTIAWSYQLLDIQEQRLFRRLSLFVGGCTLEAIEAVCAELDASKGGVSVLEGVASLIDKSLLQQMEQEGEEPRFVMLETIREYGLEAVSMSGELETTRQAHALYYLALAEQAEPHLRGAEQIRWLARLEQEHENLRAALLWLLERARMDERAEEGRQQAERCLRLCVALYWFWYIRGYRREGDNFLEQALATSSGVAASVRARALYAACDLACSLVDLERAEKQGVESLGLFREVGDKAGIAATFQQLGYLARLQCRYARARSRLEEARALFQELGDSWRRGVCLTELARVDMAQGRYDSARMLLEESLGIYKALGDQQRISWVSYLLARLLFVSGQDVAAAWNLTQQSLTVLEELDAPWDKAWSSVLLGQIVLQQGEQAQAHELFEQNVDFLKAMGDGVGATDALLGLARVARLQGDQVSAQARYQESLVLTSESGYQEGIAPSLEGLAIVTAQQGEPLRAARLWGAAEFLRETIGLPIPAIERVDYERWVATARAQLGEKAFATAWDQGRTMTPEQALATQRPVTIHEESSGMPGPTTAKTPPAYPAGLTAREVEVLRLVAQGLTDVQVAAQLVVSPRAVNFHLTSIYAKIGVSSRSAATRYAIEQHLV